MMLISTENWPRVKKLVDEALDLPTTDRAAFLDLSCPATDPLRDQVETLLARESHLGNFLENPFFTLRGDDEDFDEGRRFGPYRLVRSLGSGGMGAVYLADREDGELRQQVAIKLLKRGLDTDEILRRFQRERQILADLKHPFVSWLLDAGTADDGRPFLVMEYVEGVPIDVYCDTGGLETRERIDLFLRVCAAVQFAHQNLVVHRDLKPVNILVTADGTPKLLDFGIAKLLDRDSQFSAAADHSADPTSSSLETAPGASPLTSLYASPEQIAGGTITTATDVYALGIVLYKLLTGHHPHFGQPPLAGRESLPEKPSLAVRRRSETQHFDGGLGELSPESVSGISVTSSRRLARRLSGDLDAIVLKALEPLPERRFSSAEQLSEDLRRYLKGLPVRSRPDRFLYRAGKFVTRHSLGVAMATLITLLILGFGIVMTVQSRTIFQQNVEIERERDRAEEVTTFLETFLRSPDRGETLTVREALDSGVQLLKRRQGDDPEIRAELLDTVGGVYRNLGLYDESRPLLEEALGLRRQLYGDDHVLVAETLHNLASLERRQNPPLAEPLMRQALEIQRREFPEGHRDLARGLNNLAALLRSRKKLDEAEELAREALAMKQALFGPEHSEVTTPLNTLATVLKDQRKLKESEDLYRECLRLRRQSEDPLSRRLANILSNLAVVLVEQGKPLAALPLHEEALQIRRQLYEGDDPRLVATLNQIGRVHILLHDPETAAAFIEEGWKMELRIVDSETWTQRVAGLAKNLAWALLESGDFAGCEKLAYQALKTYDATQNSSRRGAAQSVLGGCLTGLGNFEQAQALLLEGYRSLKEAASGAETVEVRAARERLVSLYESWGRMSEAARFRSPHQS